MAMRAMAFDYVVVPLMGVPLNTIAGLTFALGSALAAAAGIFFGVAYPVLDPYMGIRIGWKAFVAAILGGRGAGRFPAGLHRDLRRRHLSVDSAGSYRLLNHLADPDFPAAWLFRRALQRPIAPLAIGERLG